MRRPVHAMPEESFPPPRSPRLRYDRLGATNAPHLQTLALDPHIKRFLLDGETVIPTWAEAEVLRSDALFQEEGFGLWLMSEAARPGEAIGFCGFRVFEELGPEPQLLYAFREAYTGQGYATEAGRALLELAFRDPDRERVVSGVDEPNAASLRVLRKLGFRDTHSEPGAFGRVLMMERRRTP